jgi:CheY-like chemotaxis protein
MSIQSRTRILVVDDDPRTREILGIMLVSAGYEVATADNGAAAVTHLSKTVPDLLVTDICMPQMSGVELMSHVRNMHPWVPIVAMSGSYQGDAVAAGVIADRFYLKGQPFQNLLATIASLVATNSTVQGAQENRTRPTLDS